MRWFVDISPIGSAGGKASRFCVEAEQWQKALQSVRVLRGDTSPFANFSIELLEDGYRAIDPATRSRYVVQKAPDGSPLTTQPVDVPVVASVPPPPPPPSKPRPSNRGEGGRRGRASDRGRRGRVSIPDDPVPPQKSVAPVAQARAVTSSPPTPVEATVSPLASTQSLPPQLAEKTEHNGAPGTSAPAARSPSVRPAAEPSSSLPPGIGTMPVARPMQAETAFERMTAGLGSFPVAPAADASQPSTSQSATVRPVEVTTEILPRFRILSERAESPSQSSPLTYREMALAVSESTTFKDAEAIVRAQYEVVRASLHASPKGQFIALAVFDHEFEAKPRRLPLATLSFKDWRDAEPVVRFPLRDARNSTNGPTSRALPGMASNESTQLNTDALPRDAKRSDDALPKVDAHSPASLAPSVAAPVTSVGHQVIHNNGSNGNSVVVASVVQVEATVPQVAPPTPPVPKLSSEPPAPKREVPAPTPSQIRRDAVEMSAEELTDVKVTAVAEPPLARVIPDAPESLTQVMPAPATLQSESSEASREAQREQALSDAPTPAMQPGQIYSAKSATDRGVFPAVNLRAPSSPDFSMTAPVDTLPSATAQEARGASSAPPAHASAPPPAHASAPPPAHASGFPPAPQGSAPPPGHGSAPPPAPLGSAPPPAKYSAPPPTQSAPPPSARPRVRGDDLIAELFEALSDLAFLADPLEGADFVLSVAMDSLPSEIGLVSFFSLDTRELVVVRMSGGSPAGLLLKRANDRVSLATRTMQGNQAVVLSEGVAEAVSDDPRWQASAVSPRHLICAPVKLGGRYMGLIELANPVDGVPYTNGDGNAVSYIATQFAEFLSQRDIVLDPERINAPRLSARVRR